MNVVFTNFSLSPTQQHTHKKNANLVAENIALSPKDQKGFRRQVSVDKKYKSRSPGL
jgi:hypothetical protein